MFYYVCMPAFVESIIPDLDVLSKDTHLSVPVIEGKNNSGISFEIPMKTLETRSDRGIKESEDIVADDTSTFEQNGHVESIIGQNKNLLTTPPMEILESIKTPQDCLDIIASKMLPEHKNLVAKEINLSDPRVAGYFIGADPEYQRFYEDYFGPTVDKLSSFDLDSSEKKRVMKIMTDMYTKFTDWDTYSEDVFLLFSQYMLRSGDAQAFSHINEMHNRYFEELSADLVESSDTEKSYLAGTRVDGVNSCAGALLGRLALLIATETKENRLPPDKAVEFSISLIDVCPWGSLKAFSEAMEVVGTENSVSILLSHLSDENERIRRFVAETLFRLELGERGVENGELEVFGKVFKLTSKKEQRYIIESLQAARRLDSHGRWGVFDKNGEAKGIFTIDAQDISPQHNEVVKKSIDLELDNLFREACIRRVDETVEERLLREEVFGEYLAHFSQVIDGMHARTGVWLNSLELHEQAFFVHVYRKAVSEGRETYVENIIKNYGEEALKVFVTMEYGESGNAILEFLGSRDVPEYTKKTILSSYYTLLSKVDVWRNVFENAEIVTGHHFASEVYEAFIRKSSEYFRAAMVIEKGKSGDVTMSELIESLSAVVYSINVLEGLYKETSNLKLEGKPQVQAECVDPECTMLIEDARTTWVLSDQKNGDRVVLSVRPRATVMVGSRPGGEARINFKVSNKNKGLEARIGLDLSDYGDFIGDYDKKPVVSLDLGTGLPNNESGIYPSQRVGRVLQLVEGSEGGHNEASFSPEAVENFESIAKNFVNFMERKFETPVGNSKER